MKKYINVEELIKIADWHGLILDGSIVENLNNEAEPMIPISYIEKLIASQSKEDKYSLLGKLQEAIASEPKKYGRLTIPEWEQLAKLDFSLLEYHVLHDLDKSIFIKDYQGDYHDVIKLLPDPKGKFWRYHGGSEQPVPDNVIIKIYENEGIGECLASDMNWSCEFGYRIIDVSIG